MGECKQPGRFCVCGGGEKKARITEGLKWHYTIPQVSLLSGRGGHLSHRGYPPSFEHFSYAWGISHRSPASLSQKPGALLPRIPCRQGADLWPLSQRWGNSGWTRCGGALAHRSDSLGLQQEAPPCSGNASPVLAPSSQCSPKGPKSRCLCEVQFWNVGNNSKSIFKNQWANRTYLQVTQDPQTATVQPLYQELAGLREVGVGDEPSFLPLCSPSFPTWSRNRWGLGLPSLWI